MWVDRLLLNYFDIMVFDCFFKINGEWLGSVVFYLFKGKRLL